MWPPSYVSPTPSAFSPEGCFGRRMRRTPHEKSGGHSPPLPYAEGGIRTHTGSPPTVFETAASTVPPLRQHDARLYGFRCPSVNRVCIQREASALPNYRRLNRCSTRTQIGSMAVEVGLVPTTPLRTLLMGVPHCQQSATLSANFPNVYLYRTTQVALLRSNSPNLIRLPIYAPASSF